MNNLSIKQISERTNINDQTLRRWEKDFNLKIPRDTETNYRYYTEKELKVIENIKSWKEKGLNTSVIKKMLERSNDYRDQEEHALDMVTTDKLTGKEFKEMIALQLKEEFENILETKLREQEEKLTEEITNRVIENVKLENQKLLNYMENQRKEQDNKKSLWSRLFGKKPLD